MNILIIYMLFYYIKFFITFIFVLFIFLSTAYKSISDAINGARHFADQALNAVAKSQHELYPPNGQSVIEIGMISLEKSNGIQKDAIKEIEKLEGKFKVKNIFFFCS